MSSCGVSLLGVEAVLNNDDARDLGTGSSSVDDRDRGINDRSFCNIVGFSLGDEAGCCCCCCCCILIQGVKLL